MTYNQQIDQMTPYLLLLTLLLLLLLRILPLLLLLCLETFDDEEALGAVGAGPALEVAIMAPLLLYLI